MEELSKIRFEALAGYSRRPETAFYAEEIGGYSSDGERTLGLLIRDLTDNDFGGIVLAKDRNGDLCSLRRSTTLLVGLSNVTDVL